jgi:hypothetical protein
MKNKTAKNIRVSGAVERALGLWLPLVMGGLVLPRQEWMSDVKVSANVPKHKFPSLFLSLPSSTETALLR